MREKPLLSSGKTASPSHNWHVVFFWKIPSRRVFRKCFLAGNFFQRALVKELWGRAVNRMKISTLFLAALLLVVNLVSGVQLFSCWVTIKMRAKNTTVTGLLRQVSSTNKGEVYCAVRESDMVFACGSAGGDADRSLPLGLGFLLVWSDNWGRWEGAGVRVS